MGQQQDERGKAQCLLALLEMGQGGGGEMGQFVKMWGGNVWKLVAWSRREQGYPARPSQWKQQQRCRGMQCRTNSLLKLGTFFAGDGRR